MQFSNLEIKEHIRNRDRRKEGNTQTINSVRVTFHLHRSLGGIATGMGWGWGWG
jgi:hypothetical protein